ncbi:hypothetical protein F3X89_17360 [Rhizobium rhizogenes]|uniref:hypothetical protein n=1 Tax=Rhizobium rhizogenes TaxID=359 RepID=UPI00193E2D97|nr:hypothetical protein [Rhizobium rhizogenes]QRM39463.1 hypothetical protein F3X89_17360 [Rhizobium rhizogenes]
MANKLPGLTPNDDVVARTGASQNTGRVVTNYQGPKTPGLRPAASPVDMYARPERAPIDNRLSDLAEALGSLNPALQRYAQNVKEEKDQLLPAHLAQRYGGRTFAEQQNMMKDDPDMKSQMGQRLIAAHAGRAAAEEAAQSIIAEYENGFDKETGDIDEFLNSRQRKIIEANPNNPFFAQEFNTVYGPIAGKLREQQLQYRVKATEDKVQDTVHGSWLGTVRAGITKGDNPEAIANALRQSYDANKNLLFVDYADQDKAMVGVIQTLTQNMDREPSDAKKYLEVIKALATEQRTASDGTKLGSLLDNAKLGPDTAQLLASADSAYGKIRDRETTDAKHGFWMQADNGNLDDDKLKEFWDNPDNKSAMTEAEYRGLRQLDFNAKQAKADKLLKANAKAQAERAKKTILDGALSAADQRGLPWLKPEHYLDENGEEKTVTVEQQRDAAVQGFLDREQRWMDTSPGKPEEKANQSFNRTVAWLSENGAKHPQWEAALKAGSAAMNTVMAGGQIPENAKKGFQLYRELVAKAPQLAYSMTDEGARTQYEIARTLVESGTLSEGEALSVSVEYNRDPSKFDSVTAKQRSDQVKDALSKFERGVWFSNFGKINNPETVSTDLQKLADIYIKAGGLSAEKALEKASEAAKRNFTNVNGWAVRTGDRSVPPDFGELATDFIRRWARGYGDKYNVEQGDLTILPLPNSATSWRIVDGAGLPLELGSGSVLTTADLYDTKERRREWEQQRIADWNKDRYKPILTLPSIGLTIGRPKWGGYTPEEAKRIQDEGRKALSAPPPDNDIKGGGGHGW